MVFVGPLVPKMCQPPGISRHADWGDPKALQDIGLVLHKSTVLRRPPSCSERLHRFKPNPNLVSSLHLQKRSPRFSSKPVKRPGTWPHSDLEAFDFVAMRAWTTLQPRVSFLKDMLTAIHACEDGEYPSSDVWTCMGDFLNPSVPISG